MKKILIAITMLASTAFAASTHISYPAYDGVDVSNLCDDGTEFRTINPLKVCESWTEIPPTGDHDYPGNWVCNSWTYEHTSVSKTGTECLKYGSGDHDAATCVEYGTYERPNTVLAEKITSYGETEKIEYFYYTIPACEK